MRIGLKACGWCVVLALGLPSASGAEETKVNVATTRRSGEKVRGPATIQLTHVNVLRYEVAQGVSVTMSNGPDLGLPFLPPIPAPEGANPAAAAALASSRAAATGTDPLLSTSRGSRTSRRTT